MMQAMLRVLLISRCPPWPLHLGDRLIVWHLARELQRRGCRLDLVALANRREDHDEVGQYRALFGEVTLVDETPRSRLALLGRQLLPRRRFPRRAAGASSAAMWQAIARQAGGGDYDCAHFFGGVQVCEYRHAAGALPALITPYESYSLYLRRALAAQGWPAAGARLRHWLARRHEAWMFMPFERRVVVAERDRGELRRINPALNWEVIPNGVDLEYFRPQVGGREAATLLFTGNFEYEPNVEAAQYLAGELLPRLRQALPAARLWLVGNGPPAALRALESEAVRVTGRVPDLRPWLAAASVYVCPLRLGAGIKNKVLEALATGCPLVATPLSVDGIAVVAGQHALVAERSGLAAAVQRLLGDAALRARLARTGRALVEEEHSWSGVAARYEALYRALARRPAAASR